MPTIAAALLPEVKRTPGVRLAAGSIFTPGGLFDARTGDQIGSQFAPKFISSGLPPELEALTYVDGRRPRGPTEATLDEAAAETSGIGLGDRIEIVGQTRARTYTLVGLTRLGSASFGGASIAQVTLPQAQRITRKVGRLDQISVAAAEGVTASRAQTADRAATARLGPGRDRTGKRRSRFRGNPRKPQLPADHAARSSPSSSSSSAPS